MSTKKLAKTAAAAILAFSVAFQLACAPPCARPPAVSFSSSGSGSSAAAGATTSAATPTTGGPSAPTAAPATRAAAPFDVATAPLDATLPFDPTIRVGTLDNGLRYYVRENGKPEKRAELRLGVNAGSLLEDDDQRGLAHFLEHMAFNGTRDFAKHELIDYLQTMGIRFGADLNASTSFDETLYMLTVPTDDEALLAKGLSVLENWAVGISFDEDEIKKEIGVVVEEWRLGKGAYERIQDKQLPLIFQGSRYADRLPIGTKESIEAANREKFLRYYQQWYRPDLMAVVAVGDFDGAKVEAMIREKFGAIPRRDGKPRPDFTVPGHAQTLISLATDPELPATQVSVLFKRPSDSEGKVGDYRRGLVETLYHGMLNERLAELTQQPDPPFLIAFSGGGSFVRGSSIYSLDARVQDGQVLRGLDAVLRETQRVDRHGFTASELERAKTELLRGYEQMAREHDKQPSEGYAAEYLRNFLEQEPVPGVETEVALARRFVPAITLDDVNKLGQKWITAENRVILITGPAKPDVPLPSEQEVLAAFSAVDRSTIDPFVDRTRDQPLLATLPNPGPVVEETTIPELGITEWRLANGIRVVLKPTTFQNDQIAFTGWSPGGTSLVDDARYESAAFATSLLAQGGVGDFDQVELSKALAGKVASASAFLSELEEGVDGGGSPEDLETSLQLAYLQLTAPRLDANAVQAFRDRLSASVANRLSRPEVVFGDKLNYVLSGNHPRRQPVDLSYIQKVKPDDSLAVYRERFADFGDATFVFVGNFEPGVLKPLIERYLGGLPGHGRKEEFKDLGIRFPQGGNPFEVRKGLEPKSSLQLVYGGEATWSREEQHQLRSLVDFLQIRLTDKIREEMGAAYGVGISGALTNRPVGSYRIGFGLSCAPHEVDRIVATIRAEIEKIKVEGPDAATLAKVRETQKRERQVSVRENSFWLQALKSYYSQGMDPRLIEDYDRLVDSVTADSLQATAKRYLGGERFVLGVLNPEIETGAQPASAPQPPPPPPGGGE
jgi:zinc protease